MKTTRNNRMARLTGMTIALAWFAGVAGVSAQEGAKGGATKLLELSGRLVTPNSRPSDLKTMSCAKCKDGFVSKVDWTTRGANKPTLTAVKHLCSSCGSDVNVVGHGKTKVSVATHTCTTCGADSLACCDTSKANPTTRGMEKNIEVAPLK